MNCALCHQRISLWDLDGAGYEGLPAHEHCAKPVRELNASLLAELEAMVLAEPDPRRHRNHLRPSPTT